MRTMLLGFTVALGVLLLSMASTDAQGPAGVSIRVENGHVDFLADGKLLTSYVTKPDAPRPFFWPVKAPDGTETTRAWPMGPALSIEGKKPDHGHHRSVWFTYGDVIPEGMELKTKLKGIEGVDFWSEAKGHGNIICTKVSEPKTDKGKASIATHNEWRTTEDEKVLDEDRKITLYNFGKAYLIVLDIDLVASIYPITFGDTKEGAMAIRIHPEITAGKGGKGKMVNAEGKINEGTIKDPQIWGHKSAWVDYSGPVGGSVVGVAVFDDPKNPYPVCWHARDYGLLAGNPFGRDKGSKFYGVKGNNERVRLAKGEHLHLRYGVLVHNGDTAEAQVAQYFERFVKLRDLEK